MKRNLVIVILCLLLVGVFATTYKMSMVGADSGFDFDYDSGSDWGGSDWGGSDWGGSDSGGGSLGPGDGLFLFHFIWGLPGAFLCNAIISKKAKKKTFWSLFIYSLVLVLMHILLFYDLKKYGFEYTIVPIVITVILLIMELAIIISKGRKPSAEEIYKFKQVMIMNDKIVTSDSNKIIKEAFNIYKELQEAWMNFNYDKIKELVSDEMYNMYTNQLETLKLKNQQNIMVCIEFINGYITDYIHTNNGETYTVQLTVSCYDYIINTKNEKVVRGNKYRKLTLTYELTFEKEINTIKNCPQCGAPIENQTECPYCKSKIVNNNSEMKLTKKRMISQR